MKTHLLWALLFPLLVGWRDAPESYQRTLHAIIVAEDHRLGDAPIFDDALVHPSPEVRALAVQAIGRIGVASNVTRLLPLQTDASVEVRRQTAFALGLIGGDAAHAAIVTRLQANAERNGAVRRELYMALGRTSTEADLALLSAGLEDRSRAARAGATQGLGSLFMKSPATLVPDAVVVERLLDIASGHGEEALGAGFALARLKAPLGAAQGTRAIAIFTHSDTIIAARLQLARAVTKLKTDAAIDALVASTTAPDATLRIEAIRGLGVQVVSDRTLGALRARFTDAVPQVAVQAMLTTLQLGSSANPLATNLVDVHANTTASTWVRGQALEALATIAPDLARPLAEQNLSRDAALVPASLRALGKFGDQAALALILPSLSSADKATTGAAIEAVAGFDDALLTTFAKDSLRTALARADLAITSYIAEIAGRAGWRDFVPSFQAVYARLTRPDDLEAKVAILGALGTLGDASTIPFLEAALTDDQHAVGMAAAAAIQTISGNDVSDRVPGAIIRSLTPTMSELRAASRAVVKLQTSKGEVVLKMRPEAPLTAHNFVRLARSGFYDGKTFHRVVPSFVAQGGDPRGDGFGGPGYVIRDEVSTLSHRRGAVGIATAGKDTGGCQLFINHAANLHLDGAYTVFAEVVRGMDVVDTLEVGDLIVHATVE